MTGSAPLLLISTDFDGTLVEHDNPAPYAPLLMEILGELRQSGVLWAINTGRTLPSLQEGLETFAFASHPDFALTSERDVYRRSTAGQWEDYGDWNRRCVTDHETLFDQANELLNRTVGTLQSKYGAKMLYDHTVRDRAGRPELAGLMARDEAHMQTIADFLDEALASIPKLAYQRNSVYLRFCHRDYHKGAALAELARLEGIPAESILAVGDHLNDLSMLDGRYAKKVACVANSVERVKEVVTAAGGFVAGLGFSAGVIEALRHYAGDLPK